MLAAVILAFPLPVHAEDYLPLVERASALLTQGRYKDAAQAFQQAHDLDMNDGLAAAGLGYALEPSGQIAAARGELALALQLDGKNAAALWANALSSLNAGNLEDARRQLEALRGQEGASSPDLAIALAYARCAAGDAAGAGKALAELGDWSALSAPQRSVAALIAGATAYAGGEYARAAESLRVAAKNLPPGNFVDAVPRRRVPLLPKLRTAHLEPLPLVSASSVGLPGRTVTGAIRLYLDPFRYPNAFYAVFVVDGRAVHSTNTAPLRYDWNTRRWRNGYHKVVIRAEDSGGQSLGQTEEVLLVHNEGAEFPLLYPADAYAHAEQTLRRAMVLQPDVLSTHYLLGLSLARLGNKEEAAASLELVMGYDPDYAQARQELQGIYADGNGERVRNVSSVPTSERKIALTFDDGPNPLYTPPLLDLLERYHAHCTMFLVGTQAEAYPDIVREIVEKGHEVANHTYSHPNLKTVNQRTVEMELLRGRTVLRRISGKPIKLFRPPGGHADIKVGDVCAEYGFTTVYWDIFDSWLQKYDERTVLSRLVSSVKPGSILLLHNGYNKTAHIAEPLLEELTRQGYQLVTVSELLAAGTPGMTPPSEAPDAPELKDEEPPAVTKAGKGAKSAAVPPGKGVKPAAAVPKPAKPAQAASAAKPAKPVKKAAAPPARLPGLPRPGEAKRLMRAPKAAAVPRPLESPGARKPAQSAAAPDRLPERQ